MNPKRLWIRLTTALVLVGCLMLLGSTVSLPGQESGLGPGTIALKAPPFVGVASAQEGTQSIASFLDDEAGISAYFNAGGPVDLAMAKAAFRTIEVQTADYIIGSVPVTDYPESEDVHVYIHRDGWLLAYYLKADPTGKIFDWRRYTGATIPTKLEKALTAVAALAGVTVSNTTFYDFRYPNATHLTLIAEDTANGNTFQVNLPGTFTYYERSWSLGSTTTRTATLSLDNVQIQIHGNGYVTSQGILTPAQLTVNVFHTIQVGVYDYSAWGGLALVYRVP
jgi:hypothetical protein